MARALLSKRERNISFPRAFRMPARLWPAQEHPTLKIRGRGTHKQRVALRMDRSWRWRWSCWRWLFVVVEVDLGGLACAFFGLEIGLVALEASHAGDQAVGEQRNVGVVVLHHLVVVAALDGDAIFRAGQLILQAHEIFVGFQLR